MPAPGPIRYGQRPRSSRLLRVRVLWTRIRRMPALHTLRRASLIGLGALVIGTGTAVAAFWLWSASLDPVDLRDPGSTVRVMAGDEELAVLQGGARRSQIWVPLAEMPPSLVDAVLAAEDRSFYHHGGFDLRGVARAALANLRRGEIRQGGSTITQQLARTLQLDSTRSWTRKARELALAIQLERRYAKRDILEAYLNRVYLGHDGEIEIHGFAAAARHVFGKDVRQLRLEESALLAAAVRAPNRVFGSNLASARSRRDAVVRAMEEIGTASERAGALAMAQPVLLRQQRPELRASYFVDVVRDELARRPRLPAGETRVDTSLDTRLQRDAETALAGGLTQIERAQRLAPGSLQGAVVAIEPESGRIRALVGGRRYRESSFNRATHAHRQPGSLFKPFVYLAAFESRRGAGLTAASLISDEPLAMPVPGGLWAPRNYDGRFQGAVTIRRALEQSLNVPAVRLAGDVGLYQVARVARAAGIESRLRPVPSLALGSSEVTLLEITGAYATLANSGLRLPPTTLDPYLAAGGGPRPAQVVTRESAFLITHLLRGVMRSGTGAASARWGLSDITAGKTGTTNDLRDAWFVGYTRDLVIGVWVGRDDAQALGLTGSQAALPIWATVMQQAIRRAAPAPFVPPDDVVLVAVDRSTGQRASPDCGGGPVVMEAFVAGSEPASLCRLQPVEDPARLQLPEIKRIES